MKLVKGKYCHKCGSKNVYLDHDQGSWYEHCLACGYAIPLKKAAPVKRDEVSWPDDITGETQGYDRLKSI